MRLTMQDNKWARLLAYITGLVNQRLLLQNEYLSAENPYGQNIRTRRLAFYDGCSCK